MAFRSTRAPLPRRARNDPRQYDDLAESWWDPKGPLAMLQWIAKARADRIPPATRPGAVLVDLGCGAGLLAPHLVEKRYFHVGLDLTFTALLQAAAHDVNVVNGDVLRLPFADAMADVVSAGEILEHVEDHSRAISEACRVLRPGGTLVIDTVAATWLARLLAIGIAEHVPGGAPPGIHDSRLFVDRRMLVETCASNGVRIKLNGLRPSFIGLFGWLLHRRGEVRMVKTAYTGVLFQAVGTKEA